MPDQPTPREAAKPLRLLLLTRALPVHGVSGARSYLAAVIDALEAEGHTVDVAALNTDAEASGSAFRLPSFRPGRGAVRVRGFRLLRGLLVPTAAPTDLLLRRGQRLLRKAGIPVAAFDPLDNWLRPPSASEHRFARQAVRDLKPDALLLNGAALAPLATTARAASGGSLRVATLTHDVLHERAASLAGSATLGEQSARLAACTEAWERAHLLASDCIVAIQWQDAATFARLLPERTTVVTPMPALAQPPSASIEPLLLFVGSAVSTNVEAARWLLAEVWPRIAAGNAAASLRIVGDVSGAVADDAAGLARVTLAGRTADLLPLLRSSISLVPLRSGSGLKIKLVEALAAGSPVVSTSVGLQGLPDDLPGTSRADDAATFADAALRLLGDAAYRIEASRGAVESARLRFSPAVAVRPLIEALRA